MTKIMRRGSATILAVCAVLFAELAVHAEEPATTPLPSMREIAPGIYAIGKMRLDKNSSTLSLPGSVRLDKGFLEYVLVAPFGSTHESLLVTEIPPSDLHFAMRNPNTSAISAVSKPEKGNTPKKLRPTIAETRPRTSSGARSCTIVFARPKRSEVPIVKKIIAATATTRFGALARSSRATKMHAAAPRK